MNSLVWIIAGVGLLGALIGILVGRKHRPKKEDAPAAEEAAPVDETPKQKKETRYTPEVNALIDDGRLAMRELGRLYASIPDAEIRKKINEIMAVSDKIVRDAIDDPADVPQIRRFLDFYLPTTIRLLNAYDRMSAQEISGDNISGSMQRIEEMLDTTIAAYKKQLDDLFANQASDIETDIEMMNGMLAREGLGGKGALDLREFMKQYNGQQKGSTGNG